LHLFLKNARNYGSKNLKKGEISNMVTLSPNGQILVVGGNPKNFKEELRIDSRLIFWNFTDHRQLGDKKIPQRTEAIFLCNCVRGSLLRRIERMAEEKAVSFVQPCKDSEEIYGLLEQCLSQQQTVPTVIEKEKMEEKIPEKKKPVMGAVTKFIRENADFSTKTPKDEIKRLYEAALSQGIQTTLNSVNHMFYREKKKVNLSSLKPETGGSIKVLEDFLNMTGLIAVAVSDIIEENKKLTAQVGKLQQETRTLKRLKKILSNV